MTVRTVSHVTQVESDPLGRAIEVGCVAPAAGPVRGVVLWCHGLGGDRSSGAGLAATWAAAGYCVVLPTFADSISLVAARHPELGLDPGAVPEQWAADQRAAGFMVASMLDWPWRADRMAVAAAVIDALDTVVAGWPRAGGLPVDTTRLGVGGHSFGAYVTQLLAGATIDTPAGAGTSFRDERVMAVVVASGQGRGQAGLVDGSWDGVKVPLLNITGTRDRGATSDDPNWKCEPFLLSPPGRRYQMVLADGDHGLGGISGTSARFPVVPAQLHLVETVSTRFWDAFLADDPAASAWLDSDRPAAELGAAARFDAR